MKFFDHAYITIESGKGGDGCASARREAGVPYGGPNGGNGGRGGHVYVNVDLQLNTLMPFKYHKIYKAHYGEPGKSRDKYGKNAEDLVLYVPLGTVIKDRHTGHVLFVGEQVLDQPYLLLKGGDGGAGNMHFKNSILQYPDFCLMGEPGQYLELELELQLLADVGLIGTPSVGKSSIINMVSNAKAQVAEYHFTTITPNLGSVSCDGVDWNVIDIPGLIEGASEGKGLGIEFLRHILKCSVFNFVIDFGRWDEGIKEFGILWTEILTYCKDRFAQEYAVTPDDIHVSIIHEDQVLLLTISYGPQHTHITNKVIMRTINKSDESDDQELRDEYEQSLIAHIQEQIQGLSQSTITTSLLSANILRTSTYLHEGITELIYHWKKLVEKYNHTGDIARHTHTVINPDRPHSVTLLETKDITEIDGYLEAKPYLLDQEDSEVDLIDDEEEDMEFDSEGEEDQHEYQQNREFDNSDALIFGDGKGDDEIFYDHWDPSISEDQIVHRDTADAIVYDISTDQYIVVEQNGTYRQRFMGGGIDAGETAEQAIIREIQEELGFDQIEQIVGLGTINAKYYHPAKKQYTQGAITCFYVEVDSSTQGSISADEQSKQTLHYLKEENITDWINVPSHQHFWEVYQEMLDEGELEEEDFETNTPVGKEEIEGEFDISLSQKIRIRSVYEPDITRIVYMVQWGNDQAEQWFWKYMQKSGGITWLKNHKVKHGDILTFEHPYYGVEERQIIFEA